jgi:hypothetical protein
LQALKSQTPLTAKDLIQEDHYQLLCTLDDVCINRKDLTLDTKFILEVLRSENSIEDALQIISRKLDFINKVLSKIR